MATKWLQLLTCLAMFAVPLSFTGCTVTTGTDEVNSDFNHPEQLLALQSSQQTVLRFKGVRRGSSEEEVAGNIGKIVGKNIPDMMRIPNVEPLSPLVLNQMFCVPGIPCQAKWPVPAHYRGYVVSYKFVTSILEVQLEHFGARAWDKGSDFKLLFMFEDNELIFAIPYDGSPVVVKDSLYTGWEILPLAGAAAAGAVIAHVVK